jgi:hypothetical protein
MHHRFILADTIQIPPELPTVTKISMIHNPP